MVGKTGGSVGDIRRDLLVSVWAEERGATALRLPVESQHPLEGKPPPIMQANAWFLVEIYTKTAVPLGFSNWAATGRFCLSISIWQRFSSLRVYPLGRLKPAISELRSKSPLCISHCRMEETVTRPALVAQEHLHKWIFLINL